MKKSKKISSIYHAIKIASILRPAVNWKYFRAHSQQHNRF